MSNWWDPLLPYLLIALEVAVTLVLTWFVGRLVSLGIGRFMRRSAPPVTTAARRLGVVVVWIIGITIAVQLIGVSPDVLLLVLLVLGIAAVVGLRKPLENFGAKYFADNYVPFKVGDTIRVMGHEGKVIEINAMTTVLLSEEAGLISVPNGAFLGEVVVNTSPQAWKELTIPISIGGSVDLASFEAALLRSLSKLRVRLDPRFPPVLTTKSRNPQTTDLILTLMIRRPEDREAIVTEVNQRLAELLGSVKTVARAAPRTLPA